MRALFDAYIMVDWSAASKPTTGENSIWVGTLIKDARLKHKFQAINPPTRHKARELISGLIARLNSRGDRVLLGVDFPLGYPVGTAKALNLDPSIAPFEAMHRLLADKVKEKSDNTNSRFAHAAGLNYTMTKGPAPFWGVVPAKDAVSTLTTTKPNFDDLPMSEFRHCEKILKQQKAGLPSSVWQLAYTGSVGSQSLLGIPMVHSLCQTNSHARIWPFMAPSVDESGQRNWGEDKLVLAEIYPSLLDVKARPGEILDQKQVEAACKFYAEADKKGTLLKYLEAPYTTQAAHDTPDIENEEGWILGVTDA